MERIRFCVFPVKNVLGRYSSREMIGGTQELFLICISLFTGVGMYFSPFASKLIWSFVSFLTERFLIGFLFASKRVFNSFFLCLVFLRSFHLFVELTLGGVFVFSLSELIFVGFFVASLSKLIFICFVDFPLIEFALNGFLVDPYSYWDSEKRHVYCSTCLF